MSSSEEYLDSLLDSILGGKPEDDENAASGAEKEAFADAEENADGGKAMSSAEIEEMLVSMGSLGGEEEEMQEGDSEEDMEAMLAFMDEHNAAASDSGMGGDVELSLDALDMGEDGLDDMLSGDLSTEEGGMDELPDLDDLSLDDLDLGEDGLDDMLSDEVSLDDLSTEEGGMDELPDLDDLSLDDLDLGEDGLDDMLSNELSVGDMETEEGGMDELPDLDDLSLDDLDMGDDSLDDMLADELSLDDVASSGEDDMSDLALEEADDMDGLMSEDDIDRLLSGDMDGDGASDDFALEESGESDDDLSTLLAGMDHDEDLSEINDLLEESDQGVSTDDDMLAMLEGADDGSFDLFENDEAAREAQNIRELTPEEAAAKEGGDEPKKKEKKKRKKLFGKKKGGEENAEGAGDELEALLGEGSEQEEEKEEKKPGFFARLLNFLLESDDDEDPLAAEVLADNDGETGTVTDENKELLEELSEEDKKGKKKKKKDKKKGKKGKGGEGEGDGEGDGEGEEDNKKAKKKKKKEKKEKKADGEEVDLLAPPEKKLSKKKVIPVFVFCATIGACIVLLTSFLPDYMEKREAQMAYDHREYAEVYNLLYGKELNEQEEILFQRSNLVLQMNRKLTSYENYVNLDMRLEALNALVTGVGRYQVILPEAETYNVVGEVNDIYAQILERLSVDFGMSEQDALEILASEDDVTYTQRLESVINGALLGDEEASGGRQDILPEEEEIIDRIDGLEDEYGEEQPESDTSAEEGFEEDMQPDEETGEDAEPDENPEEDMLPEEMMTDEADI